MNAAPTTLRRLAQGAMRHAVRVLSQHRSPWARAMDEEMHHIDDDYAALLWSLGCIRAGYTERLRSAARGSTVTGQLLRTLFVTIFFASLFMYVNIYLAAIAYPDWYAEFTAPLGHLAWHLWGLLALGIPEAIVAAACSATLARLADNATGATARRSFPSVALSLWVLLPFAFDLLNPDMSFTDYVEGTETFWPDIVLRLLLVCSTFLIVFRCVANNDRTTPSARLTLNPLPQGESHAFSD